MSCFSKRCRNNHNAFAELSKHTKKIVVKVRKKIDKNLNIETEENI